MLVGVVPTDRKKRDWKLDIKTKEQYDLAVASGIGWVVYEDLPFSWADAQKELAYQAKVEYIEDTREYNYKASSRLDS